MIEEAIARLQQVPEALSDEDSDAVLSRVDAFEKAGRAGGHAAQGPDSSLNIFLIAGSSLGESSVAFSMKANAMRGSLVSLKI